MQYKKTDQTYITKVADFGLAAIKPKAKKTIRADPRGTPLTRAPEVMVLRHCSLAVTNAEGFIHYRSCSGNPSTRRPTSTPLA